MKQRLRSNIGRKRSAPAPDANLLALAALPSLGLTSAQMLISVGIPSKAKLRALGPEACFRALRFHFGRRVSTNFIYAIECAIRGIDCRMLEPARKADLRAAARSVVLDLDGAMAADTQSRSTLNPGRARSGPSGSRTRTDGDRG
jgi:hypothetical protein